MSKYIQTFEKFTNKSTKVYYRADHYKRDIFYKSAYASISGMYFTTDKKYAESYGTYITVAEITLKNPLIVDDVNDITDWNFDYDELKEAGYDGLSYTDGDGEEIIYVFSPEQINIIEQYSNIEQED